MNRTLHTNDVVARIKTEVAKINSDGTLPPGVKLVPFYDRTILVSVTTHTVLHNLIFGCLLVFLVQWVFLGNLRSAIIVGINIPFALFFSIIILVLARRGRESSVDRRHRLRHRHQFGGHPGREYLQELSGTARGETSAAGATCGAKMGRRSDAADGIRSSPRTWTDRLRLILVSALQVDKAVFFSTAITVAAFVPLFTMQGVEGQIFSPMARTYGYALIGALLATFTISPVLASYLLPDHVEEAETIVVRVLRADLYAGPALVIVAPQDHGRDRRRISAVLWPAGVTARHRIPAGARRRQSVDPRGDAADYIAGSRHADRRQNSQDTASPSGSDYRGVATWPAGQRQRRRRVQQRRVLRAAQAVRGMGARNDQGKADQRTAVAVFQRVRGYRFQFLAIHPGQCRGRALRRQRRQFGENHRPRLGEAGAALRPGDEGDGEGPGRDRPRRLSGAWTTQSERQGGSRQSGPLRAQCRRHQYCRSGGARWDHGDDAARGGSPIQRHGAARAPISR